MAVETPSAAGDPSDGADALSRRRSGRRPGRLARIRIYYREIVSELRKVIYPTRSELVTYVVVVLIFVTVMVAIVSGLDYVFTKLDLAVFS